MRNDGPTKVRRRLKCIGVRRSATLLLAACMLWAPLFGTLSDMARMVYAAESDSGSGKSTWDESGSGSGKSTWAP
mgnify:CR=1 FL=1